MFYLNLKIPKTVRILESYHRNRSEIDHGSERLSEIFIDDSRSLFDVRPY